MIKMKEILLSSAETGDTTLLPNYTRSIWKKLKEMTIYEEALTLILTS